MERHTAMSRVKPTVYAPMRKALPTICGMISSLSASSMRPVRKFFRPAGRTDSTRYEFRLSWEKVLCVRPQMKLDAQFPWGTGRVYSRDAVVRFWSPGSSASGRAILPVDTCAAQRRLGKYDNRADQELMGPVWMVQRFSQGSVP